MAQFDDEIRKALTLMRPHGIAIEDGLSEDELAASEKRFGFQFPPDLRELLRSAFPVGPSLPNWRSGNESELRDRLGWPFDGMAFDIEHNGFWLDEWGTRPGGLRDAICVARSHLEKSPKLIPVYGHRYLPEEPLLAGNPVFSVYQTDIIYYGENLWDYFAREFGPNKWHSGRQYANSDEHYAAHRHIRFWSDLTS